MPFIMSTMSNSVKYVKWDTRTDVPRQEAAVFIHGGANMPSDISGIGRMERDDAGKPIWTTEGVITSVTDEQLEILRKIDLFNRHEADGYIRVLNSNIAGNEKAVAKQAASMEQDGFGLLTKDTIKDRIRVSVDHPDQNRNRL